MLTRDGKLLARGDRVPVAIEPITGDAASHAGTVVAFAEADNDWRAVVVLDKPTPSGTPMIEVTPPQVVWLPADLDAEGPPTSK